MAMGAFVFTFQSSLEPNSWLVRALWFPQKMSRYSNLCRAQININSSISGVHLHTAVGHLLNSPSSASLHILLSLCFRPGGRRDGRDSVPDVPLGGAEADVPRGRQEVPLRPLARHLHRRPLRLQGRPHRHRPHLRRLQPGLLHLQRLRRGV